MATRKTSNKKSYGGKTDRAKVVVPKAGVTKSHRRYGDGGQFK